MELRKAIMLAAFAVCGWVATPAHAFRCGGDLVQEGDRKYDVRSKCGAPDYRDSHAGAFLEGVGPIDVTETWYYNPGPTRFVRVLTFRQGKLRSIETGGRGFNETASSRDCRPYELEIGMSKFELLSRCGSPVARDRWLEHGVSPLRDHGHSQGVVLVEEWTYVFGSTRFRRFIRIVDGKITAIEAGDKGG